MSHSFDDYYSVYDETVRRARKEHTCNACAETIRAGDRYVRIFIVFNVKTETLNRCARCQKLHLHLRGKGREDGLWPGERLDCGESYESHWDEEPPADIAALAFALPGEVPL